MWRNVNREVAEKHDMEEIEMAGSMELDQHNIQEMVLHGIIPVPYEARLLLRRLGLTLPSSRCILLAASSGSRWSCMSKAPSGHGLQCGYLSKALVYLETLQAYIFPVHSSVKGLLLPWLWLLFTPQSSRRRSLLKPTRQIPHLSTDHPQPTIKLFLPLPSSLNLSS